MREIRLFGSEGGVALTTPSLPLSIAGTLESAALSAPFWVGATSDLHSREDLIREYWVGWAVSFAAAERFSKKRQIRAQGSATSIGWAWPGLL